MSARALYADAVQFPYDQFDDAAYDDAYAAAAGDTLGTFYSGEPACPPFEHRRNPIRRFYVALSLLIAIGWLVAHVQSDWTRLAAASLLHLFDHGATTAPDATAASTTAPSAATAPQPTSEAQIAIPPQQTAKDVSAPPLPETAIALPPVTAVSGPERNSATDATVKPDPAPLTAPAVDPSDPFQKRAAAAGLHPKLSRALLAKLSPADYRNAKLAIEQAVAKTPDSGTFTWPAKQNMKRKPQLALFEVHFVAGAAHDCRRYVVTIAKDGWTTTALPMEKCGPSQNRRPA